jgi:hypothetical protein
MFVSFLFAGGKVGALHRISKTRGWGRLTTGN